MLLIRNSLMLAGAALLAGMPAAHAQSPNDYPWCLVVSDKLGSWTCYFRTREQCMASAGGNVGFCAENPAYQGPPQTSPRQRRHNG
jgi:hypothetical protein